MGMKLVKSNAAGMSWAALCAAAIACLALPAFGGELAILSNGFTIRHEHRQVIGDTTRLYFSPDDSSFTDVPTAQITGYEKDVAQPLSRPPSPSLTDTSFTRSAMDLTEVVNSASAAYHLDPDLVNSVIHAESGFNSRAVSRKGARGLMQLMPSTADQLGVKDSFDPEANVGGGSHYLRELLERYDFDLVKALAAYNAGPQRVEQYNGVPPFRETRAYVARIVHEYNRKKIAQGKAEARTNKLQAAQSTMQSAARPAGKPVQSRKSAPTAGGAAGRKPKYSAKSSSQLATDPAGAASPR